MTTLVTEQLIRHRIRVTGVVQGVGFRPFVYRLASRLELSGEVGNDEQGVFIDVEGSNIAIASFEEGLSAQAPPLARIDGIDIVSIETSGKNGFRIVESRATGAVRTFVAPDIAVCADCLTELFDAEDRRYRYPFINCTNCGPRFTITMRLPYDRPNTTMRDFELCPQCAMEYENPADRRFHAQPVACATCGPRIWFEDAHGVLDGTEVALVGAQSALARGEIVAIKGLGGYHLACDATSKEAVSRLRGRKARGDKPFAVMVQDLAAISQIASVGPEEAALLASPQRPIVLLAQREHSVLVPLVAPANPYVGVLLPYTPLHHLLFAAVPGSSVPVPRMLVMTSGNLSDEPICYEDADARDRLDRTADAWLIHNRPIYVPCDDSVVRIEAGKELPIRRSRGYAPLPLRMPFDIEPILAAGGELKNTFCLASGRHAWMSQHIGDMGSLATLAAFEHSTRQFRDTYQVQPASIAADAHPRYQTRRWAEQHSAEQDSVGSTELIQHHHAHIAAVMAEHHVPPDERVIGFAFDGTGYGSDGAIWGGEVLVASYEAFDRAAHLRYVPLPGGDATIKKPSRAALAHLWAADIEWSGDLAPVRATPSIEQNVIARQLERRVQCVPTSSMGRLFDAVSSLLDVRHLVSYEGQAAIELETVAASGLDRPGAYRFDLTHGEIDPAPLFRSIVRDLRVGRPRGEIAAGFHLAVARLIADCAERLRSETGIDRVALSGGVFQNVLLVGLARTELARDDFEVLTHHVVPPNDGGLALGQAAIAGWRVANRTAK